jgi:hypothetical protein
MTRRTFAKRSRIEASADEVFRWHARPGALERLSPPWDPTVVESRNGGIEDNGARVVLRVGPLRQRWVAEHHGAVPGRAFHDRQVAGPFAFWEHAHRMVPDGEKACTLRTGSSTLSPRALSATPWAAGRSGLFSSGCSRTGTG